MAGRGGPRTAAQMAALKKAQEASARKRRGTGKAKPTVTRRSTKTPVQKAAATRAANKAKKAKETQAYLRNYSKLTREQDLRVSKQADKTSRIQRAVQGWGTRGLTNYDKRVMKRLGVKPGGKGIPIGGSKESNAIAKRLWDMQQVQTRKKVARLAARNTKKKKR